MRRGGRGRRGRGARRMRRRGRGGRRPSAAMRQQMAVGKFGRLHPRRRQQFRRICGNRKCFGKYMKRFFGVRRQTRSHFLRACNGNMPCAFGRVRKFFAGFRAVRKAAKGSCKQKNRRSKMKCVQGKLIKFEKTQLAAAKKLKTNKKLKPSKRISRGGRRGGRRGRGGNKMQRALQRFGNIHPGRVAQFRRICGKDRKCFRSYMKKFMGNRRGLRGNFMRACNRNLPCAFGRVRKFFVGFRAVRKAAKGSCKQKNRRAKTKCIQGKLIKYETAQRAAGKKLKVNKSLKPSRGGRRGGRRGRGRMFRGFTRLHPIRRKFLRQMCGRNKNCFKQAARRIIRTRRRMLSTFGR